MFSSVEFEYAPRKSASNLEKHGIDFETAKELWNGKIVAGPAKSENEPRILAIGKLGGRFWSVILTMRGGRIRLISARRSKDREIENYKNNS